MPEITGYAFPNDIHIHWSLMIVMYPYITGFVAGAFIVSSMYHVFGKQEFKPVARLAMAASFCFMAVAALPLQLHLGHPERGILVMVTPHFTSAMAGFGVLYSTYFLILALEVWFVWRVEIIEMARRSRGLKRTFYSMLALGTYDTSPRAREIDHRAMTILAGIGLPGACMLHGYVGFIFGGVKANPWWSSPLMPVIFLLSAGVSGIALLILIHQVWAKFRGSPVEPQTVAGMAKTLWFFLIMTITLELLEIIMLAYEKSEPWHIISQLLTTRLEFSFFTVQMVMGGLIPLILLGVVVLMEKFLHDRVRNMLAVTSALLLLLQVFAMRWNVVIGGQMISKSLIGLRSPYDPDVFGREGVIMAIVLFVTPFVLLLVFNRVLPIKEPEGQGHGEAHAPAGAVHGAAST